jgi:hypothetical protein
MATSADDVDRVLRSKLGVKERPAGSNRTEFGAWYGMSGVPWCAIFMSWGLWTAFRAHGDRSPLEGCRTAKGAAYCGDVIAQAKRESRFRPNPQRGFLVVYDFPGNADRFDHIGWVTWTDPADGNHFRALEGNTSATAAGSQSNGGMVAERPPQRPGLRLRVLHVPYTPGRPRRHGPRARLARQVVSLTSPFTRGKDVTAVQAQLNARRAAGAGWINALAVDGSTAPPPPPPCTSTRGGTELQADGQVGPVTWHNMHRAIIPRLGGRRLSTTPQVIGKRRMHDRAPTRLAAAAGKRRRTRP